MTTTRLNTLTDALADAVDGPRTTALDDPAEIAGLLDDESLEALLREEFLLADELAEKDAFSEDIPDAALFLPFRDGRSCWR